MGTAPSKADNLFIDAIRYGPGLTITGTNATAGLGFNEIADADEDKTKKYGILTRLPGGGYSLTGKLVFGTGSVDFTDNQNSKIFIRDNSILGKTLSNTGVLGFELVGNGTGTTNFQLGTLLGSGDDRQGILGGLISSVNDKFFFDAETDTSDIDTCELYGVTFENASNIKLSGSTTQEAIGCTFIRCDEVQPNNAEFLNNKIIEPVPQRGLEILSTHAIKQVDFISSSSVDLPVFQAWENYSTTWDNVTDEINDSSVTNTVWVNSGWTDAAGWAGSTRKFSELKINVTSARTGGAHVWEYYNGSSWTALQNVVDGTNALLTTGTNSVTFDIPLDWAPIGVVDNISDNRQLYNIRLRASTSVTTAATLTQMWITSTSEHHLHAPVAGTFSSSDLNFFGTSGDTKFDTENSSDATTEDSYPDTNQDSTQQLGNGTILGVGQSITGAGGKLSRVRFELSKSGTPTGNAVAKLYTHSGTFGTSSIPTGTALATSENLDVSTLSTTAALVDLEFEDEVTLTNTTKYVIALEYTNGDGSNYVLMGTDTSSPTHGGNASTLTGTTWSPASGTDLIFYVYTGGIVKLNVSGSNPTYDINTGVPPGATVYQSLVNITLTGLIANTEVRVYEYGTTNEIDGVENSSTSFQFQADSSQFIDIVIHHIEYVHLRIENFDVPTTNTSIPISQQEDRTYDNP
jgi:hypothetical protein